MNTQSSRLKFLRAPGSAGKSIWSRLHHFGYLIPAGVVLVAFAMYPLVQLVRMSLSDVTAMTLQDDWSFVGRDNFVTIVETGDLGTTLANTIAFVAIVTTLGLLGGLGAAIALRSSKGGSAFLLGLMVFVWALPPVVNGSVWKFLLGDVGLINTIVRWTGISETSVPFLYDQQFALISVAVVNSWAVIPFNTLVFRAALLGVAPEVLEAAKIDGARPFDEIRYVLIPSTKSTAIVLAVLTVVYAFRSFDFIYVMTYGGPGTSTVTLPFLGYLQAFVQYDYGLGAATSVIAALMVLILAALYARSVKKEESDA